MTLAPRRESLALATLGLGAFTVGTSELVVVGILDPIADDLDTSISAAGSLVTAYALGIALGGPILTVLTARADRRVMLRLALAAYAAANLVMAVSASFGVLFATRLIAGAVHGAFIGLASVAAASLAGEGREGRAIAMVFGGVAISTVIGVPLGALVGQTLGWRASFLSVAALGALALALTVALVPRVGARGSGRTLNQARAAFALPVLAMLGVGFLIIGGQFTTLTYLEPFLREVTHVSS